MQDPGAACRLGMVPFVKLWNCATRTHINIHLCMKVCVCSRVKQICAFVFHSHRSNLITMLLTHTHKRTVCVSLFTCMLAYLWNYDGNAWEQLNRHVVSEGATCCFAYHNQYRTIASDILSSCFEQDTKRYVLHGTVRSNVNVYKRKSDFKIPWIKQESQKLHFICCISYSGMAFSLLEILLVCNTIEDSKEVCFVSGI